MKNLIYKVVGACSVAAVMTLAACGGGEEDNNVNCADGQQYANVNGQEKCWDQCTDGMCATGQTCEQGLCIPASNNGNNGGTNNGGTNNGGTNNGGTNNGGTNNGGTNNGGTNNGGTNNGGTNNGAACADALNPPLGLCDPLCQSGCADNEGCQAGQAGPGAALMSQCLPAGAGTQGATCDQMNGCAAGYGCIVTEQGAMSGTCVEYCRLDGAGTCTDAAATCNAAFQGETRLGVCLVAMDSCQILNDMCPDGQKCAPTTAGNQCVATAGKAAGEQCNPGECGKALLCVQVGATPTCRLLCDPTNDTVCNQGAGQACNALDNLDGVGICI